MIRTTLIAIGLWLITGGLALACVCSEPRGEAERSEVAQRIASNAAAVAEVELVEPMNFKAMRPELFRVHRLLVGSAPVRFTLDRQFGKSPTGEVYLMATSCDEVPVAGRRTLVVLYRAPNSDRYWIGGTCDHIFVNSPGAVELIRAEFARREAERG